MSVIQTCISNNCRFDTRQEGAEILERNTTHESLLDDPCFETRRLVQEIENITGYSDADWAEDPTTKNTSCTLCYVDHFLLTHECKGQGTVA